MAYPYIASDLDGTIVKNEDFKILDETIADILNYQEKSGSKFFIVTGRLFETSKLYINQLHVTLPIIGANGAVIIDPITQKVLYQSIIEKDICEKIFDFALANNLDLIYYSAKALIGLETSERINYYKEAYKDLERNLQPNCEIYPDFEQFKMSAMNEIHKPFKFLFSFPTTGSESLVEKTTKFLNDLKLNCPITHMNERIFVDAMNNNVNKATGLEKWAEIMNVELDEIHPIGDNNNDYEMVAQFKNGCVVANGVEKTKQVASKILEDIYSNGVGKYLQTLSHPQNDD
ncbi:HAD family hydrolase [Spiroplasma culicicola]|uniref:HAD family hydrolase n=1 Tax=Spiroplasma culicicola AES-1 TaxID=1276246 RepID=W6A7D6_9MOLU|nr:HAD family hydrolase [Spiroplasma culicicola]AHI53058.1 HAD family hydrolase [Spiroplasma culicicola AES-1]